MRNVNRQVAQDNSDVESEEDAEAPVQKGTNYLVQDNDDTLDEPARFRTNSTEEILLDS